MHGQRPIGEPAAGGWFARARERFYPYRTRFNDWHFWAIQVLIIAIAGFHTLSGLGLVAPYLETYIFVPVTLFFLPVVYASVKFGFSGAVATAAWTTVITIPNIIFLDHGISKFGEIIQLIIVITAAVLLGHWSDRETNARLRAKAYAMHVVNAQERERQRIARDLHDDTVQTLVLLCQRLDALKSTASVPPLAITKLQEVRTTAEQAATGLRQFARELRPPMLDDLGMVAAIRKLVMDFMDRTAIDGRMEIKGEEQRLPPDLELAIFRIAQEALSNVERHAAATRVSVLFSFSSGTVTMEILDNGVGFVVPRKPADGPIPAKLGIIGMRERVELLHGSLQIQSVPGAGTRISVSIPLKLAAAA